MARILIVEDEPQIRLLLEGAFTRAGYEVRVAAQASEAIEICRSEGFDVLLSDVVMPGMSGHELAQWVAVHHPGMRTALMSGFDLECEGCAYSPRCELLPKPFRLTDAVAFVERILAADCH